MPEVRAPFSAAFSQTLWLCITPLARPVVPEVQSTAAVSP